MRPKRFTAMILSGHKEDAVEVPFDPAAVWSVSPQPIRPGRRGFPVEAAINGTRFESFIVSRSRRLFLLLPERVESEADVCAGDRVHVSVEPRGTSGSQ